MPKLEVPRFTFWRGVLLVILALGTYATVIRFFKGLAASTNLSDAFPWGLWIGFDVLCGVALAAGGFTISATVYIFNLEKFRPIVRPAILTAFLTWRVLNIIPDIVMTGAVLLGGIYWIRNRRDEVEAAEGSHHESPKEH